ncbi:MAG: HAD-IG family 5'-nucleotidase [Candidatus Sericytochromatia bacterium]
MDKISKSLLLYSPQRLDILSTLIEENNDISKRIFVNRTVRMEEIKYIGFDMDYTLAVYRKKEIEELAFIITLGKLVADHGYPEKIKEIKYDENYVIRGLVIDKLKGNVLKIDKHKAIRRADHGTRALTDKEIKEHYSSGKVKSLDERYFSVDTLFSLPEAYMFAKMVDMIDAGELQIADYTKLFEDIRVCIDKAHKDNSLKSEICKNLDKYIEKDLKLPLVLDKLRKKGKKLFVLTNSEWSYTNTVMSHLLNNTLLEYKDWTSFFDIVSCHACKPEFFKGGSRFYEVNRETGEFYQNEISTLEKDRIYAKGNFTDFETIINSKGDEILYVGDHIYGDILRSNKESGWRTVLVIEELEEEIEKTQESYYDLKSLNILEEKRDRLDYELTVYSNKLKSIQNFKKNSYESLSEEEKEITNKSLSDINNACKSLDTKLHKVVNHIAKTKKRIDSSFHKKWGPIFHESDEITRFGEQVRDYAWIYTSKITNLFFYTADNYFKSHRDIMPHEKDMLF